MNIDNSTKGAWLIHHANKLQDVRDSSPFENIHTAGKAGMLLSALSTSDKLVIDNKKLRVFAQEANISAIEQKGLLEILKEQELIDISSSGIAILGLTTSATLEHTTKIFENQNPTNTEQASILLAEKTSSAPCERMTILTEMADIYKLDKSIMTDFQTNIEEIGLIDIENIDKENTLYFNGNLFKREDTKKINKILSTLKQEEQTKLISFNKLLDEKSCISTDEANRELGKNLFSKLSSIGMYDINIVSNEKGEVGFVTKPSSFSKYSQSTVDDAFDLAKAFVSSLTYGMTKSNSSRGQISMIEALLRKLIRGEEVGPVDAIGQDYKILELKHVVEIKQGQKRSFYGNMRTGWMMKLLKKDVGELALQAIIQGDISEQSLDSLLGATVNHYTAPEINRKVIRKKTIERTPKATNDMLSALRTGGL